MNRIFIIQHFNKKLNFFNFKLMKELFAEYERNKFKDRSLIFNNYRPISVGLDQINPFINPKVSIPSMIFSILSVSYYKKRYFLINAPSMIIFSGILNYSIMYYLLINMDNMAQFLKHSKFFDSG